MYFIFCLSVLFLSVRLGAFWREKEEGILLVLIVIFSE